MIHYALRCADGHEFDGWFRSSVSFDEQAAAQLLACPVCSSTSVARALMAPRIASGAPAPSGQGAASSGAQAQAQTPGGQAPGAPAHGTPAHGAQAQPAPPQVAPQDGSSSQAPPTAMEKSPSPRLPDGMRAALQRIRAEVEKRCDYVGPHFASEVRRMAEAGEERRPVYGEATEEEASALAEDGIAVSRIPWVPRADS